MLKKYLLIAASCVLFASSAAAAQQPSEVEMGNAIRKGVDERVDKRVDERLNQYERRQVAVTSKPGEYAQHSERYTVYLANCKSLGMNPTLRDETAAKFDKMSDAEFRKHLGACPQALKDREDAQLVQVADNTYVNAPVSIGGNPGYGRRPYGAPGYGHPGGNLSAADNAALRGIAQRALGPVPADARGYTTHVTRVKGAPAPGCVEVRERQAGGGTFARWKCPRGTINRLGW